MGTTRGQSGVGLAMGSHPDDQRSIPITNSEDNFHLRSNQRAELCATKLGLELHAEDWEEDRGSIASKSTGMRGNECTSGTSTYS